MKDIISKFRITFILMFLCAAILPMAAEAANTRKFVLVIDPGHGGNDAGACDNSQKEKDINLGVGRQLADMVEDKLKDVKVVMTRDDDTYLTLQQRADKANAAKGDLFISIHTNSVDKANKNRTSVAGSSVYALGLHKDNNNMAVARRENSVIELENDYAARYSGFDPNRDESYIIFEMAQKKNLSNSIRFARDAQSQLVSHAGRRDRGVHQAGFWVLWATSMPAVLVELDFICNPYQAEYLGSDKGQKKLAEALFKAVEAYIGSAGAKVPVAQTPAHAEKEKVNSPAATAKATPAATAKSTPKSEYAQRRRRSTAGRVKSASRDLTADNIPLHTADERMEQASEALMHSAETERHLDPKELKKAEKIARDKARKAEKERQAEEKRLRKQREREAQQLAREEKKHKNSRDGKVQKINTSYHIQILASKDLLKDSNPRFQGLRPIRVIHENNLYKYTYGEGKTKEEMETLLIKVKEKFPDAFIVRSLH